MNIDDDEVPTIAPPASWLTRSPHLLDLDQAAHLLRVDPNDLEARQTLRVDHIETYGRAWSSDLPVDDDGRCPRLALLVWAARMGLYPRRLNGHHVIGYAGIAERLGYRSGAYARRLAMLAAGQPPDMALPAALFKLDLPPRKIVLRDWPEVRRWAIHTSRLDPDGVTPLVKRPRRGPARG